jgi:hypothetical protein
LKAAESRGRGALVAFLLKQESGVDAASTLLCRAFQQS